MIPARLPRPRHALRAALTALVALTLSGTAFAQDDEEDLDDLDDFLNELMGEEDPAGEEDAELDDGPDIDLSDPAPDREESVGDEIRAVREGDLDDRTGVKSEDIILPGDEEGRRRVIKTLQQKTFLKLGRYEGSLLAGFVSNDPFINRYLLNANVGYHLTEILAIQGAFSFSPDFGEGDWKPITTQLVNENRVSPDISKIIFTAGVNFEFSPIYGKIAVVGEDIISFDIFGSFGSGIVHTEDDLTALQCNNDVRCEATASQNHPTMNFGGGFRVIFSDNFALRLEGKSLIYIETVNSTTLEYKNNLMLNGGVSFFFPNVE